MSGSSFLPSITNETFAFDKLIAGDYPRISSTVTLISGQNLARGAVLGKITSSGKYTLSLTASSDGSQVPVAILSDAVNASSADTPAPIYHSGEFDETQVILGTGWTTSTARVALRAANIYLKPVVQQSGAEG